MTDLPGSVAPQTQGLILGPLHNSTLARTFVINAAEMEHTVHDDTMQFFLVLGVLLHSIAANRVETDIYITVDYRTLGIVKSDNVCIIIVGKVLAVDLNDFVITRTPPRRWCNRGEQPQSAATAWYRGGES